MQKSAEAFRTISEVADDLSLPQHVLRFWETRFPQIRPLKRAGGRRYYRPADVLLLRTIRQLLYDDGYTIKGVQRQLKEQGVKGLGSAAPRPFDVGADSSDLDDSPEAMDADDAGPPPASTEAEACVADTRSGDVPVAKTPYVAKPLYGDHRAAIEDALATVEECRRILDALLRPSR